MQNAYWRSKTEMSLRALETPVAALDIIDIDPHGQNYRTRWHGDKSPRMSR